MMLASAPPPEAYLILSAVLFAAGAVGVMVRRNALVLFMCIELMLNAVSLTFVTYARQLGDLGVDLDDHLAHGLNRKREHGLASRRFSKRKVAHMHRQLFGDLLVGQAL